MVNTLSRNGAGGRFARPRPQPVLLAEVALPFRGEGYEGVTILYDVAAVREVLESDWLRALGAELDPRETAIRDNPDLDDAAKQDAIDDLLIEWAHRLIGRTVAAVEWPYGDADRPDPRDPTTFDVWDPQVVFWIAQDGLAQAGAQFSGPLARRARRSRS